jgi:hypothetical protein
MAVEPSTEHNHGDIQAHVRDYSRFTGMVKWGTIICAILGFIVVFLVIA